MDATVGFFYLFSAVLLYAAFRVITARNPVHAVLHLILAFSQASGLWLLLKAEFLAITLVVVYLGAVMVLFLFVVMMLDIRIDALKRSFWHNFPLAAGMGILIVLEMAAVLMKGFGHVQEPAVLEAAATAAGQYSNTKALGSLLYTQYLLPVEIAAVILLVAMIAAIALTLRQRKDTKAINPSEQVHVRASDRVKLVQLPVTQQAPEPTPEEANSQENQEKKP